MYRKLKYLVFSIGYLYLLIFMSSCKKDWLDAKPEKALVVPSSIRDYQALLDNNSNGNAPFNSDQSLLGEISAGDFYVTDASWSTANLIERKAYIWSPDLYEQNKEYGSWQISYSCIFYTNVILEGIEKIAPINNAEEQQWNQVKGSALFFRAYRHYDLAQIFCKPYDKNTAKTDLGIPLRLHSDFNIRSSRSTVEDTYNQIVKDLKQAAELLPITKPNVSEKIYKLRPTRAAAYAMLARVYLAMAVYDQALIYATKTLELYSSLLDYNNLSGGLYKFPMFNDEVILNVTGSSYLILGVARVTVDSSLIKMYDVNDRRKDRFLINALGGIRFIGNYTQSQTFFTGLATDEVYLIKAECYARTGNKDAALSDLNTLIQKRWSNSVPYPTIAAVDANDALKKIIDERRKELCFRNLRWTDLRRLNREPQFSKTLTRIINGQSYTLLPNSLGYVLPIPPDVIELTGMEQNPR